ncbi:efflux RND transporter permease subunit [Aliivibrio fischeri]|uniref:AcrB/AcrD/AcrF family metabolite exporter n=1 Tax=Aliivibrio fischeri SR5 TaxID=1088719 RepID=A0AAV3EPM2_ALIFS|nr:efflux RND transporter permease subunit [Aliivibrio fischeri]EHN68921.1 AcrB/AcrD/AcrF family metabolite exporter [Aliivibrio fischeri SR5]
MDNKNSVAAFFVKNKIISWMVTLILLLGGAVDFFKLGQLEDPEFTIKDAIITTTYPGASAKQVESQVTNIIEEKLQNLKYVDKIVSWSSDGASYINLTLPKTVTKDQVQQIWDDLRRKVESATPLLPNGASPPSVNDDFGDVYGVLINIYADGLTLNHIEDYSDYLKRELLKVPGIGKISVTGKVNRKIFIEIESSVLANLGISSELISNELKEQNLISNSGDITLSGRIIRYNPTGEIKNIEDIKNLLIKPSSSKELIRLGDIANIYEGDDEKPYQWIRLNGQDALSFGISFAPGVNVVNVGKKLQEKMNELSLSQPNGIKLDYVYNQPNNVEHSVNGFLKNLLEACAIITVVLFFAMGLKAGVLISFILVVTISGTFIAMNFFNIQLQRISLGALIIALGMLIDNAIVIVEGVIIGLEKGESKFKSIIAIVKQTQWPLLAATVIAIIAFAPIGLSPDATGEMIGSLFWVLLFSLFLSWITAVTITPYFCNVFYKEDEYANHSEHKDPYGGLLFRIFKISLDKAMKYPVILIVFLILLLVGAGKGFGLLKNEFFPPTTTNQFQLDIWALSGTDIRKMKKEIEEYEHYLLSIDDIQQVSTSIGNGHTRFILPYKPEHHYENFATMLIKADSVEKLVPTISKIMTESKQRFPHLTIDAKRFAVGPTTPGAIEVRVDGPDPVTLRQLSEVIKKVMLKTHGVSTVRDDWMARTLSIQPVFDEANARLLGISKSDLDKVLKENSSGRMIGSFRDGTETKSIIFRSPEKDRYQFEQLGNIGIWSPLTSNFVHLNQVISHIETTFEDPIIVRRNRTRTITVMANFDVTTGDTAASVRSRMLDDINQIQNELPDGYHLEWGGKYEKSVDAKQSVFASIPGGYLVMFILTILLFNSIRNALVIWFVVPLSVIGVVGGLLVFNMPFTFMTLLGALSLTGMMIRNGIVLVDQININQKEGMSVYDAIFDGAVSRVRPVSLTAIAAIMGMIPLLKDSFFASMAAAMMVGLALATLLTLYAVPVFYKLLYRIKYQPILNK